MAPASGGRLVIPNQGACIVLGIGALLAATWAFDQAWEARGKERPRVARWLFI